VVIANALDERVLTGTSKILIEKRNHPIGSTNHASQRKWPLVFLLVEVVHCCELEIPTSNVSRKKG